MATLNKKGILERLSEGVVLGDGGYLLELEKRGRVRAGPFTPEVALNNPESLLELHREFRDAGAEVLQALTFYASRDKLATVGMGERVEELNRAAVRIAKQAAGDRCLVAGNLSLTWMYEPNDEAAADRVRKTFDEQLDVQVAEGVDFIIGETFSWLNSKNNPPGFCLYLNKSTGILSVFANARFNIDNDKLFRGGSFLAWLIRVSHF